MKKYVYFISGIYCEGKEISFFNAEASCARAITGMEEIIEICEQIKKDAGYNHRPTITNYILMRVE